MTIKQPLVDIRAVRIDPTLPAQERIRLFAQALGDPYTFKVGETPVHICFSDGAPSLQRCLTELCERLQ